MSLDRRPTAPALAAPTLAIHAFHPTAAGAAGAAAPPPPAPDITPVPGRDPPVRV
jgi:hypothetical protein